MYLIGHLRGLQQGFILVHLQLVLHHHHHLHRMHAEQLDLRGRQVSVNPDDRAAGWGGGGASVWRRGRGLGLATLQVFLSISRCLFSCSSDSFSFWTRRLMCAGKSSAPRYSANAATNHQTGGGVGQQTREPCYIHSDKCFSFFWGGSLSFCPYLRSSWGLSTCRSACRHS